MFRAKNNQLPANILRLFTEGEGCYNLRGLFKCNCVRVRRTRRGFCFSVCGVTLWNSLNLKLKECPNIIQFKNRYKEMIFMRYRDGGVYVTQVPVVCMCAYVCCMYVSISVYVCMYVYVCVCMCV